MTNLNSVSDLARSYQLRTSQTSLKSKLDTLSREAATLVKSDIPQALSGDLTRINQIEARLAQLKSYGDNISEAQGALSRMQISVESIQTAVAATGPILLSESLLSSDSALAIQVEKSPDDLKAVISALNASSAGRFLFSGTRSNQPAVVGYEELMGQLSSAIGGSTDPVTILANINSYFDSAVGMGGFSDISYAGSNEGTNRTAVATDQQLGVNITANSSEFRETLKGLAIMSYAAENVAIGGQGLRELTRAAGTFLAGGDRQLTAARTEIGLQEETAAKLKTTYTAETSALQIARINLISADPYETAAALKEVEANIETIYTLTARLSKLSLTGYL